MMDLETLRRIAESAAGDVASKAVTGAVVRAFAHRKQLRERFGPALEELWLRALPQAREKMAANQGKFIGHLAAELAARDVASDRIGDDPKAPSSPLADAMTDPAIAVALYSTLHSAGQTPSEERHRVLAKLVATRLGAKSESARAAQSAFALETAVRLGREHLQVLGLLALVRHIPSIPVVHEPPGIVESDAVVPGAPDYLERSEARLAALRPFLRATALPLAERIAEWGNQHGVGRMATASDALHLLSAGCVIPGSKSLDFVHAISRPEAWMAQGSESKHRMLQQWLADAVIEQAREIPSGAQLVDVWNRSLTYLVPTPAGLLLGFAVHDAVTGETRLRNAEWSPDDERPWSPVEQ